MALDVLQSILEAEKSAAEVLQKAEQGAADVVKTAELVAREREREATLESREQYRNMLEQAREAAQAGLQALSGERRGAIDVGMQEALVFLPKAVDMIVGEVMHGNR